MASGGCEVELREEARARIGWHGFRAVVGGEQSLGRYGAREVALRFGSVRLGSAWFCVFRMSTFPVVHPAARAGKSCGSWDVLSKKAGNWEETPPHTPVSNQVWPIRFVTRAS